MSDPGYIYVLINPSMQGLVKIGKSARDPSERAKELSGATGVPTPFVLVFHRFFQNCSKAEERVHALLEQRNYRVSDNREFFAASVNAVIDAILEVSEQLGGDASHDHQVQADALPASSINASDMTRDKAGESWREVLQMALDSLDGSGDTLQDYSMAKRLFLQAARLGSPQAYLYLGRMHRDGDGCQVEEEKALDYFQKGAQGGAGEGFAEMASIYFDRDHYDNALKCWDKYFSCDQFNGGKSQSDYASRSELCCNYLKQVEKGLPFEHRNELVSIREEISAYAGYWLGSWRTSPGYATGSSEIAATVVQMLQETAEVIDDLLFRTIQGSKPRWDDGIDEWRDAFVQGKAFLDKEDRSAAIERFEEAVRLGSSLACFHLGQLDSYEDRLRHFKRAARRGVGDGYAEMARIYAADGLYENALSMWSKYFDSDSFREQPTEYVLVDTFSRDMYGYEYMKEVKAGMPLRHKSNLHPIRGDILAYVSKSLAFNLSLRTGIQSKEVPDDLYDIVERQIDEFEGMEEFIKDALY